MSGILAVLRRDGRPVDRGLAGAMLAAVAHRGPDGLRLALDGPLALGHARLVVTPESAAEYQPLTSPRGGCRIVADLRLDNREELRRRLPDETPASIGDAELLLRLYEAYGDAMLPWLLGDFAFAIWDPRRRRIVCARDTAGQRSLFYRLDRAVFVAASEIQQLLQDADVTIAPCEERIRDYLTPFHLTHNAKQTRLTFYEGVYALQAGHVLTVDEDGAHDRRYWTLTPPAEIRYRRAEEYAEHFRAIFFEAVRTRIRSDRPVGALLSGGLDSSSIVCTAQALYQTGAADDHGFTSFTTAYDGLACDEQEYVAEMAARWGFDARFLPPGAYAGRLQPDPGRPLDEPSYGDEERRSTIYAAAAERGVRVLLTGETGDNVMCGSPLVMDWLLRHGRPATALRYLRAARAHSSESWARLLAFGVVTPLLPLRLQRALTLAAIRRDGRLARGALLPDWMPEPLRHDLEQRSLAARAAVERGRLFGTPARHDIASSLDPPDRTHDPAPWPLEMAQPFADRRVQQFVLAIPPDLIFDARASKTSYYGGEKRLLRAAMRGILPEAVRTRANKTVFDVARVNEMTAQWPVYAAVFGEGEARIVQRGYVLREPFWRELQELRSQDYSRLFEYVLQLCGLETFLRSLERQSVGKTASDWRDGLAADLIAV